MGPLSGAVGAAGGALLAVEVGAVSGMLGQRVLGQYEFPILEPEAPARLLFVSPNLAQAARQPRGRAPTSCCAGSRCTRSRTRCSSAACRGCGRTSPAMVRELLGGLDVDPKRLLKRARQLATCAASWTSCARATSRR